MSKFATGLHRSISAYFDTGLRTGNHEIRMTKSGMLYTTIATQLGNYVVNDGFVRHSRAYFHVLNPSSSSGWSPYRSEVGKSWFAVRQGGGIFTIAPKGNDAKQIFSDIGLTIYKPSTLVSHDPDPSRTGYLQAYIPLDLPSTERDDTVVVQTDLSNIPPYYVSTFQEARNAFFTQPPREIEAEDNLALIAIAQQLAITLRPPDEQRRAI